MAKFEINVPFETDQPTVVVEVDPRSPLARGRHKFQLEVIDDSGNVSLPDTVDVIVADRERPTAVIAGPGVESEPVSLDVSVGTGLIVPRRPVTPLPIDRGLIP